MPVTFNPISTAIVRACQAGGPDGNGQVPERKIPDGAEMQVLAFLPRNRRCPKGH